MGVDLDIEEVLLFAFLFGVMAATLGAMPIAIGWLVFEAGRSLWSLRDRWSDVLRAQIIVGGIAWVFFTLLLGAALGGWFGLGLVVYLLAVGTVAVAHA
jgi:hypothetical protein